MLIANGTAILRRVSLKFKVFFGNIAFPLASVSTLLYKMLEDMLALANCLLASVVVWYVRKRKHSKARHSTAQHGTVPHRTAGHDIARHRTALRCAVDLAKLS